MQMLFNLMQFHLSIFTFAAYAFRVISKKIVVYINTNISPVFSYTTIMIAGIILKFLYIFIYGVR
jgi:hypothetical protein